VAPVLLLVAAALSIAAVFVVHDIEAAGGPLSQPSAVPPYFSPNGDGRQDEVEISFTTKRAERITVDIRDSRGRRVARLLDDAKVDGEKTVTWDGDGARNGTYRAVITRAGDRREYETTERIVLDTKPPKGRIDRARLDGDRLVGLALLEPDTTIVFVDAEGDQIDDSRVFAPPNPDAVSARPTGRVPRGLEVRLFYVDGMPADLFVEDLAGNRVGLHLGVDAPGSIPESERS
jgi:hypothetical protein